MDNVLVGIIYETVVILVAFTLLLMIIRRMKEKSSTTIKKIFFIFLFFTLAIVGSWGGKLLFYLELSTQFPQNLYEKIILLIVDFRFSFVFVSFSLYYSALLQIEIFKEEVKVKNKWVHLLITFAISLVCLSLHETGVFIYDVIVFALVFFHMMLIYLPFMIRTLKTASGINDIKYKKALQSLGIMAFCFIMVLFSFLIDRIIIMMTGESYSAFYYLAWLFGLVSLISAYLGYIKPKE